MKIFEEFVNTYLKEYYRETAFNLLKLRHKDLEELSK